MPANKENVRKWVEALRSPEFAQGKGYLRTENDQYCCLGVACELYRRETGEGAWDYDEEAPWVFRAPDGELIATSLPDAVMGWLGIDERDPRPFDSDGGRLSERNDGGIGFGEIADAIEREWL